MNAADAIVLVAELTFNDPVDDEVRRALAAVVAATRAEPGCLEYAAHLHAEDPRRVFFYERWQDQPALDGHNASAHLAAFRAVVRPRLAGVPVLSFWRRLESSSRP